MKTFVLGLLLFFSIVPAVNASHFMGGEIWWECLPDGKYKFHASLYQECYGINYSNTEIMYTTVPGLTQFNMNKVAISDITPQCFNNPSFPHIWCDSVTGNNQGGIREWIYESAPVQLPQTVPPPNGWVFTINICNRNNCTNIINASSYCGYIRAIMYSYNNQPASPCFDNSPFYAEKCTFVASTGLPQSINHYVYDLDGDSLSYSWAQPWTDNNVPITAYNTGYTYTSPLPGISQNPLNVPGIIDQQTGELTFKSFTQGAFVCCFKTSAYKNGIHVADIFREEQMILLSTGSADMPFISPPFPANPVNQWTDTIDPGQNVSIQLIGIDTGYLNDTFTPQSVSITANGLFFGSGFTSASCCCPLPPCATLTPVPPATFQVTDTITFNWSPTFQHLLFGNTIAPDFKEFDFSFRYIDDFCPVPGSTTKTLRLILRNPVLPPPVLTNYSVNSINGEVTINFIPTVDNYGLFDKYMVYKKDSLTGEFELFDSIANISQTSYISPDLLLPGEYFWYYFKTKTMTRLSDSSNILTNFYVGNPETTVFVNDIRLSYNIENSCISVIGTAEKSIELSFQLYDCLGVTQFRKNIQLQAGLNYQEIPVKINSAGVYFYILGNAVVKYSGKVLIFN